MENPNCYECIYRRSVPGSAHSSCRHPEVAEFTKDPMLGIMAIFSSAGRTNPMQVAGKLGIVGDPHGVANGWFTWPWDFDPVWLRQCNGLTRREEKDG